MKCWIFPEWECYIEGREIPLEVCRLCVEARLKIPVYVKRKEVRSS